jgi:hypothetical protein
MDVAAMDVKCPLLQRNRVGDAGISVPHGGDIIVKIDVTPTRSVEEMRAFAPDQLDGVTVEQFCSRTKKLVTAVQKSSDIHVAMFHSMMRSLSVDFARICVLLSM